ARIGRIMALVQCAAILLRLRREAEAATVDFVSLETLWVFVPLPLTDASLEVVVLFEVPNRWPTVAVEKCLIFRVKRPQQFDIVVAYLVVVDGDVVETEDRQLVRVVDLARLEQFQHDRPD